MFKRISQLSLLLALANPLLAQNMNHLKVELLSEQNSVVPGGSVTVGFHFRMQRGWHIYWNNPGDSGQTPSITWTLPDGFSAGDIQWPTPERITLPNLADYGYTNEVTLMVPIQIPQSLKVNHIARISAHIRWLVCNEICIPGDASFNLRFLVKKKKPNVVSSHEYLFQTARRNLPQNLPEDWKVTGTLGKKEFHLSLDTGENFSKSAVLLFFPFHQNQIENAAPQVMKLSGSTINLALKRSDQLPDGLESLEGLLVLKDKKKSPKAYPVVIPLEGE